MGDWAFSDCSSLKDVYCYAEDIPETYSNAFDGSPIESATLHVSRRSLSQYQVTPPWSNFKAILPITTKYSLTYILDGVVYKSSKIEYNASITPEPAPTKEGHTFSGWTGLPATMPAHDVEVTGSFNVNSYTLTYKVDGNIYKTFYIPYGIAITPIEAPVKKGMTFSGWGNVPETMPARDLTLNATYTWSKERVDGVIYQVTDTLNNYASVVGNESFSGEATILPTIEIGGYVYAINTIGDNAFKNCNGIVDTYFFKSSCN